MLAVSYPGTMPVFTRQAEQSQLRRAYVCRLPPHPSPQPTPFSILTPPKSAVLCCKLTRPSSSCTTRVTGHIKEVAFVPWQLLLVELGSLNTSGLLVFDSTQTTIQSKPTNCPVSPTQKVQPFLPESAYTLPFPSHALSFNLLQNHRQFRIWASILSPVSLSLSCVLPPGTLYYCLQLPIVPTPRTH